MHHFFIYVGNEAGSIYTMCVRYTDTVPASANVTLTCDEPNTSGRYIKMQKMKNSTKTSRSHLLRFCEFIVSGYKYIGEWSTIM